VLCAIESGTSPLITAEDGRRTVELISAIYESALFGRPVSLPMTKDNAFYTVSGIQQNAPHFYEKTKSIENFSSEVITFGGGRTS
jgi:hypothetical protein